MARRAFLCACSCAALAAPTAAAGGAETADARAPAQPWDEAKVRAALAAIEGGAPQTCHACELVVDEVQNRMAASWVPAMDSTKARRAKTRGAMRALCGVEGFKGWAKLTNKEAGSDPQGEVAAGPGGETVAKLSTGQLAYSFVDFARTMEKGGNIDGSLSMGPEVAATLRAFATALLSRHGAALALEAAAPNVTRVFDFDMRERLCVEMGGLCTSKRAPPPPRAAEQAKRSGAPAGKAGGEEGDEGEEDEGEEEDEEDEVITMNDEL